MKRKFQILVLALLLVAGGGSAYASNSVAESTPRNDKKKKVEKSQETIDPKSVGLDIDFDADPKRMAKIKVGKYKKYGLTEMESIIPFVVKSNETITLKDPDSVNGGLNGVRFDSWGEKEWLDNNYIRAARLYFDAYQRGIVKNEHFDKVKSVIKGKFVILNIAPFMGGGAWFFVSFVDNPSTVFRIWVYSFVADGKIIGYDVRAADVLDEKMELTAKDVKAEIKKNPTIKVW